MKTLSTQKRLAAEVLGVGKGRVLFDPDRLADIKEALTKEDIRELIKDEAIKAKAIKRKIRGRKKSKKKKNKRKIKRRKQDYVHKIRKLRKYLLSVKRDIGIKEYRNLRKLAKAGQFKSKEYLREYVEKSLKKALSKSEAKSAEKVKAKTKYMQGKKQRQSTKNKIKNKEKA